MTFKRICSVLLAGVIFSCNIAANIVFGVGSVYAEELRTSDEVSADVLPIAEFDSEDGMKNALDEYLPCEIVNDDVRMFETAMKVSASADGEQSYFAKKNLSWDFASEEYSEYNYLNFWINIPETIPTNADGAPSDLCVLLRTRDNSNLKAYYYFVPMERSGWQLISIPRENFVNRSSSATWENTSEVKELWVITNVEEKTAEGAALWPLDGSGYILMDYMYLSKSMPEEAIAVTGSNIENGAVNVPENIEGNRTLSLSAAKELLSDTLDKNAVEVSVNGEIISEGYSVSADGTEINIVFAEDLALNSEYSVTLNPGCVFDEYGNTLEDVYATGFVTAEASSTYKVTGTNPENGSQEAAVDLGGALTYELTMSNPPSGEAELQSGISLLKNDLKVYDGYSISVEENTIKVVMNELLEYGTEYTIELSDKLTDAFGNVISGETSFSFTTEEAEAKTIDLIAMDDESSYAKTLNEKITLTSENANIYDKALRVNIPAAVAPSDTVQLKRSYSSDNLLDASKYSYLNYWIYSPEKTDSGLNFLCYTSGGNYRYHLALDWAGWKLVSIALTDFYVLSNTPTWEKVTEVRIDANSYTGYITPWPNGGYILVDKIFLSKELPVAFDYVGSSLPKDYHNAPVKDFEVGFTYTDTVSSALDGAVTVVKDGTEQNVAAEVTFDGSQLRVKINEKLEYNTKYNIEINNNVFDASGQKSANPVSYSFTTAAEGISVGKPVFNVNGIPSAGESISVTASAVNDTENTQSGVLTVVQYDSAGTVLDITDATKNVNPDEETELSADVTIKDGTVTIRAFVCDNAEDRNQLRADYSVLGAEETEEQKLYDSSADAQTLTVDVPELSIDRMKIDGKYSGAGTVLIRMIDENGADILLVPVYANTSENYSYQYTFADNLESGEYMIEASSFGGQSQTAKVNYLDGDDRANALEQINNGEAILQVLSDNKEYFGVSSLSDKQLECIAQTLLEQKPYNSFNDMLSMLDTAMNVLEQLNDTAWGGMSELLKKYSGIILYDNGDYSYYKALTTAKQNEINREIEKAMPVESFEEFRGIFGSKVDEYKDNSSSTSSSKGSGGGGGGGGGGGVTIQNNTSGLKVEIPVSPVQQTNKAEVKTEIFADLAGYSWAEESIEKLYAMNVISASDDRCFRPGDNVTREEFVKMLVTALGIAPEIGNSGFADAVEGTWYQPYISAAKKAGITEGKPDGSFGIGEQITRQDMSVMAYRALTAIGKELVQTEETVQFTDENNISEYAMESVSAMQRAGILSGMENGEFCPLSYAQRAQAAKVIAGLIEALK